MAKIYGNLERAQVEVVSALPTGAGAIRGRIVQLDTVDGANDVGNYIHNGTAWYRLVSGLGSDGGSAILKSVSTPAMPSSGYGKLYFKSDGSLYQLNDAGTESKVGSGSGSGINYILNPDGETSTTGWATYKDAAASTPVDGTGGSPTLTFTRSTSSPLRATGSFVITTTAANLQGEGASYDFVVDAADRSKVLSISFNYQIASGTYADGDMVVYIYDVTNSTLMQPAGYSILNNTGYAKQIATFQTSATGVNYRLILHRAVSTSSAMTMKLDGFIVGPQVVQYGAPITDWQSYTPTWTGSTSNPAIGNGTLTGKYRRVGDSIELAIFVNSGTTTTYGSGRYIFGLPSGITIDTAKINNASSGSDNLGIISAYNGTTWYSGNVIYETSTTISGETDGTTSRWGTSSPFAPASSTANQSWGLKCTLPVVGFSSSVQMSSDTDTRIVAMNSNLTGSVTGTLSGAWNIAKFPVSNDTHGAYSASTGLYTVPVQGWYRVSATLDISAATSAVNNLTGVALGKNGTNIAVKIENCQTTSTKEFMPSCSMDILCIAGDTLGVYSYCNMTTPAFTNNNGGSSMSISRISGPSAIAASETVAMRASTTNGQTITDTANDVITTWTTGYDTHSGFNATTGVYTVPVSGKYRISAATSSTSAARTVASGKYAALKLSGTKSVQLHAAVVWASITTYIVMSGSTTHSFNAGDTISLTISNQLGSNYVLDGAAGDNWICVERIGN